MDKLDYFGHWGYFFLAIGMLFIAQREKAGWAFRFFGEAIWVILGYTMGMTSIWMWGLGFMLVDAYGYRKWQSEKDQLDKLTKEYNDFCENFNYDRMKISEVDIEAARKAIKDTEGYWMAAGDPVELPEKRKTSGKNKTKQRQSERARVAKKSRSTRSRKVQSTRGRRDKQTNGKRRIRSNVKPRSTAKSRGDV